MVDYPSIAEEELKIEKTYDASDPVVVNEARKKAGRQKKRKLDFVQFIMETPLGREWLYRLMLGCDVFRNSYRKGEDKTDYGFREGMKFIGLQLMSDTRKASPDLFDLMIRECENKKLMPLYPIDGVLD